MKKRCDIVLIDSGINQKHEKIVGINIEGCTFKYDFLHNKAIIYEGDFEDLNGHGTAVFYLLHKLCKEANIYIIKLAGEELNSFILQRALEYIYKEIDCFYIHLSIGVEYCDNVEELEVVCNRLSDKGITIISAFSNLGCVSYPAAFDSVIGVDENRESRHINKYDFYENCIVNVRIASTSLYVPWGTGGIEKVAGTSFSTPFITAKIYSDFGKKRNSLKCVKEKLREDARRVHKMVPSINSKNLFQIKNAVIFPFNKEMHALIRASNMLTFKIKHIYDSRYLGNVGKTTANILEDKKVEEYLIEDIEKINWDDDFDTIVVGHTEVLEEMTQQCYTRNIVNEGLKRGKKVYLFDESLFENSSGENPNIFIPIVEKKHVPMQLLGKLYCISTPILCVIGTSSRQGKFTLQNLLVRKFIDKRYKVARLGTEPSTKLFSETEIFPMGYKSTIKINGYDSVAVVNYLLHNLDIKKPDIIIAGTQAETVAASVACIENIPKEQDYFLYGVNADGYILVCNYFDEIDYIRRTISHAESINGMRVLAVVMFPADNNLQWSVLGIKSRVSDSEAFLKKQEISKLIGKKVYILGIEEEMDELFHLILEYFVTDQEK